MAPDIPLKILEWLMNYGLVGFLVGLMFLLAIFRGWHFYKLLSGDAVTHKAVFAEAKQLIRSEYWGKRYQLFLKKMLDNITKTIGDNYRFPDEKPSPNFSPARATPSE